MDKMLDTALWYRKLRETNNQTYMPLFFDEHRHLVLKGGGSSGKSVFAARKVIERVMCEPGHRYLVMRKVANTIKKSCWQEILDQLAEFYPGQYRINKTDLTIYCSNGSLIWFVGLDDTEKLKSIKGVSSEWIEEATEITKADFLQMDLRMRGPRPYYKQVILTFNPISITHWLKEYFFDREDDRVLTHESTYLSNRFLPEEDRRVLEEYKNTDRYYYEVYCLGMWGTTGRTVFDGEAVTRRLLEKIRPIRTGRFEYTDDGLRLSDFKFVEDRLGGIKIYKEPEKGAPYVIGGDTAGDGSDSFVAQVIDNRTGEQVAKLRQQYDEDLFAKQVYALGVYYNTALIGIETNWSTYPVLTLERLGYPKQYVRETVDNYTHKPRRSYGFETNSKTRPIIISELIRAVREDINIVCDEDTLQEMLTFVRDESFRPEAEEGAHDDCVMALAIAHYIRPQQDYLTKEEVQKRKWTPAMWEDYRNARGPDKEELIRRWGPPTR